MSMNGELWQLKMTVEMRTQKSRTTTMLQRRIIAWGGDEGRGREVVDMKKGAKDIVTNATAIKGISCCKCCEVN